MSLLAIRERLPYPAFVIVLVIVLMLAGFACACLTDHPEQALDRALFALTELPLPLVEAAVLALAALLTVPVLAQPLERTRLQIFRL